MNPPQIELLTSGKNMTMIINGGQPKTIMNEGEKQHMTVDEPLYLGGLPSSIRESAVDKWHIRNPISFHGNCHYHNTT